MFNLLVDSVQTAWDNSSNTLSRSRIFEYTPSDIATRYNDLDDEAIKELKGLPTLFMIEGEARPTKIGYINNIRRLTNGEIAIDFEIDPYLSEIESGKIKEIQSKLDLDNFEFYRTHWAIKDVRLFEVLMEDGILTQDQVNASVSNRTPLFPLPEYDEKDFDSKNIFVVHGRDGATLLELKSYLESLTLVPIVLQDVASGGRTIIEMIEEYSNVKFAIVLYTPCDIGYKKWELTRKYRARQNVIFEHGYLMSKLGRENISFLIKDEIELPSDIVGLRHIKIDEGKNWQHQIKLELGNAGYQIPKESN